MVGPVTCSHLLHAFLHIAHTSRIFTYASVRYCLFFLSTHVTSLNRFFLFFPYLLSLFSLFDITHFITYFRDDYIYFLHRHIA
jgi:hypothetical protein